MGINKRINRRQFLTNAAIIGAAGTVGSIGSGVVLSSCSSSKENGSSGIKKSAEELGMYSFVDKAPDGRPLTAGLIGCGSRGTGAALQFLKAGNDLKITYLADLFPDRMSACREKLSSEGNNVVADDHCFLGFDAYKKVLDSDVDVVLLTTPTHFRPEHFKAAVEAKKHIFMEKPCAVDPVGVRTVLAAAKQAKAAGLTVVTGNQRHHRKDYWEAYVQVQNGAIGDILSGACHWDMGNIWEVQRHPEWSDVEYCLRDWFNWRWVSGDSMLDLMVHNIDILTWFMGGYPKSAVGYGGCARKRVGDTYDYFSIDYMLDNNRPMLVTTRQIDGCQTRIGEFLRGTKGAAILNDVGEMKLVDNDNRVIWEYKDANGQPLPVKNPYEQEHVHLVESIRKNLKLNQAEILALSTLTGIMGREAAYTGKEISWDEIMASTLRLGPAEYALGALPKEVYNPGYPPLPGVDTKG